MDQLKHGHGFSKYLWLFFLAIGAVGFFLSWVAFPHHREKATLIQYVIQIILFIIFLLAVSLFPNKMKSRYLLLTVPFIIYLGFFSPKMTYLACQGKMDPYYSLEFNFLYPGFIMAICLAYRLGGGSPGKCLKTGLNGMILIFSGFLDLMWFVTNRLDYAKTVGTIPHIQVIIGHVPSLNELIVFMAIHFILLIIINCLPFDQWMNSTEQ